jgi:hypothetical protein
VLGIVMLVNLVHPLNVPASVISDGRPVLGSVSKVTLARLVHPLKLLPIDVIFFGMLMLVKEVQFPNIKLPRVVIPAALVVGSVSNVAVVSEVHPLHIWVPMDVRERGIVMLVKEVHPKNTL